MEHEHIAVKMCEVFRPNNHGCFIDSEQIRMQVLEVQLTSAAIIQTWLPFKCGCFLDLYYRPITLATVWIVFKIVQSRTLNHMGFECQYFLHSLLRQHSYKLT